MPNFQYRRPGPKVERAPQDDGAELKKLGKRFKYRAVAFKHIATNTWANVFAAANFDASGQDLAGDAAAVTKPGESPYNNWLTAEMRPRFRFEPRAIGFHISDPANDRVKSILLENARLEMKRGNGSTRIVNEPLLMLPPGTWVRRESRTTVSGVSTVDEEHEVDPGIGMMKIPGGTVLEMTEVISLPLFIEAAALTALQGLVGNAPAEGFTLGVVLYGDAFGEGALPI